MSNAFVTIFHATTFYGNNIIGKVSFWTAIFNNATIDIPTGVVSFKTNKIHSDLLLLGGINLAIQPQAELEIFESSSTRPNAGSLYLGKSISNCGPVDLASDNTIDVCEVDMLSGCYSPVFARPAGAINKTKIWVNKVDSNSDGTALCVPNKGMVNYLIKAQ